MNRISAGFFAVKDVNKKINDIERNILLGK